MKRNLPTAKRVRELFDYDAISGEFTNRIQRSSNAAVGAPAGCKCSRGYLRIVVEGRSYMAHRLAWLYAYGVWPKDQIDHIDCSPSNNALANLREADNSINCQNKRRPRVDNRSGYLGVSAYRGGWRAQIKIDGKSRDIGVFKSPELAFGAYVKAKQEIHPGCTL